MELIQRWPQLADLARHAKEIGNLELWVFGSVLGETEPRDLDVAVVYGDRVHLQELRSRRCWELTLPPIDLIGLTHDEDQELRFLEGTAAVCLLPC